MATSSWSAGIIRPVAVAPSGPYQDSTASGVWTMDEAAFWTKQGLWPTAGNIAPTGLFGGGLAGGNYSSVIQYVIITSAGNSTTFGDLNYSGTGGTSACSSATRGVFGGGYSNGRTNTMDYVTIATKGNAINFGSLALPSGDSSTLGVGSASNSTRGLWAGGQPSAGVTNVIQYITIATTGNTTSFGDLTSSRCFISACASPTRAVFGGGGNFASSPSTTMDYVTTASTGNATNFGSLGASSAQMAVGVCSSSTRGLFAAVQATYSSGASNIIEYITIATTGNSTDFGDLTISTAGNRKASTSSTTRGLFAGGGDGPSINVIDFVTIASIGNATDFGDLLNTTSGAAGLSNCHGGL